MTPASHPAGDTAERTALIHREIIQLGVLIALAIAAFLLTRAVATSNREMSLLDAAEWYSRGLQQIGANRNDDAIESFRRATVRNREDKHYVLALAQALALKGDDDAARGVLLTLRESAPEDVEINLELARLAAARGDVTDALRFYRNALYAPWPVEQADARRRVRFELIRFLLAQDQTGRALAELLALSADLRDDAAPRLEAAELFATAGDNSHALDQFQRVIALAPGNAEALVGAGQAAFQLGDYARARTYLERAPARAVDAKHTLEISGLVLSSDPLANRLGSVERRRRLAADLLYAQQRLSECPAQGPAGQSPDDDALQDEAQAFAKQLRPFGILEQDTVEAGVGLIDRIERVVAQRCAPPTPLDQALVLIGRQHGAGTR